MTHSFEIGDQVEWTSQSNAYVRTRQGTIVYKSDPKERFTPIRVADEFFPNHVRMFGGLKFEKKGGYLVEVVDSNPDSKRKPRLYMPKVSYLKPGKSA